MFMHAFMYIHSIIFCGTQTHLTVVSSTNVSPPLMFLQTPGVLVLWKIRKCKVLDDCCAGEASTSQSDCY